MGAQGCASWARNPRDPKSHLFVTKWVAIPPFWTSEAGFCTEFRCGSRQIGVPPSISTFFQQFLDPKMPKMPKSGHVFEGPETARVGLAIPPHRGPRGPMWRLLGAILAHKGPKSKKRCFLCEKKRPCEERRSCPGGLGAKSTP